MIDYSDVQKTYELLNKLYGVRNITCEMGSSYHENSGIMHVEMPMVGYFKMVKDIRELVQYLGSAEDEEKMEIKLTFDEAMSFENLEERQ